jgi:hypothetical protein
LVARTARGSHLPRSAGSSCLGSWDSSWLLLLLHLLEQHRH